MSAKAKSATFLGSHTEVTPLEITLVLRRTGAASGNRLPVASWPQRP
ncbi:MAG: hypothetical protein JOY91_08320, partial [Sinobacteraceae bacterium]|nr:hypothetical protein [Nevskiaceae bacterium]